MYRCTVGCHVAGASATAGASAVRLATGLRPRCAHAAWAGIIDIEVLGIMVSSVVGMRWWWDGDGMGKRDDRRNLRTVRRCDSEAAAAADIRSTADTHKVRSTATYKKGGTLTRCRRPRSTTRSVHDSSLTRGGGERQSVAAC